MSISILSNAVLSVSSSSTPATSAATTTSSVPTGASMLFSIYSNYAKIAATDISTVSSAFGRLTALAGQAASGTLTDDQRATLSEHFQTIYANLQQFVSQQSPSSGNSKANLATTALASYIFTGAANAPTKDQASLALANPLAGLGTLSVTDPASAYSAYQALQAASQSLTDSSKDLSDFQATLNYANNNIHGLPNNGPSITQVDAANDATQLAATAQSGVTQVMTALTQMRDLAEHASDPSLTDTDRAFLNQHFASLLNQINSIVGSTTGAHNRPLLNGSVDTSIMPTLTPYLFDNGANEPTADYAELKIGNLLTASLFDGTMPDISTQQSAKDALSAVALAVGKTFTASNEVTEFQYAVNYAKYNMGLNSERPELPYPGLGMLGSLSDPVTHPAPVNPLPNPDSTVAVTLGTPLPALELLGPPLSSTPISINLNTNSQLVAQLGKTNITA